MKNYASAVINQRKSGIGLQPRFSNVQDIVGYTHWLVMRGQLAGNLRFDGHVASEEEREIDSKCKALCSILEKKLWSCQEANISDLLECYDIVFRLGYRQMPDTAVMERHKRRLFDAWRRGNREIEESSVFGVIAPDAKYHPEKVGTEVVKAYTSILDRWINTLKRHGYFPDATAYENFQRLALVMRENIDSYFNGKDFNGNGSGFTGNSSGFTGNTFTGTGTEAKHVWYERNKVDDLTTLGSRILRSYRRFASSLFPDVLDCEQQSDLDAAILAELSTRSDLNTYNHKAFIFALQYQREMTKT